MMKRFRAALSWENWPFACIYAPLSFAWLYYIIRARAVWFFSNVNPTLEFAGFEGENKKEMYEQLPEGSCPATIYIAASEALASVRQKIQDAGIPFPFIVKPQVGMHGLLFRKIDHIEQLLQYHSYVDVDYIIQEYVDLPLELSVFHIRYPGQAKGIITGLIAKKYLAVTGNGRSTLCQLMQENTKARARIDEMRHKIGADMERVLPKGEQYLLSIAGNHNRGASFINLQREINDRLCAVFDRLSNYAGHFYFGRYDLKCRSLEDLRKGKNFYILEYNGAGAEPNHIYDCGMSYFAALRVIHMHWKHLYHISRINLRNGFGYWGFRRGLRYLAVAKRFFKKMRATDLGLPMEIGAAAAYRTGATENTEAQAQACIRHAE